MVHRAVGATVTAFFLSLALAFVLGELHVSSPYAVRAVMSFVIISAAVFVVDFGTDTAFRRVIEDHHEQHAQQEQEQGEA